MKTSWSPALVGAAVLLFIVLLISPLSAETVPTLSVTSRPDQAEVSLDGKVIGLTNVSEVPLTAGSHTLEIKKQGFTRQTKTFVAGTDSMFLHFELVSDSIQLYVATQPAGAGLYLDGQPVGFTVAAASSAAGGVSEEFLMPPVLPGAHQLEITKDCWEPRKIPLNISGRGAYHMKPIPLVPSYSSLEIRSDKKLEVYMDGKAIGSSDERSLEVCSGNHVLEVACSGQKMGSKQIQLRKNQSLQLSFSGGRLSWANMLPRENPGSLGFRCTFTFNPQAAKEKYGTDAGCLVNAIIDKSPSRAAGLDREDLVVAFNGMPIRDQIDHAAMTDAAREGAEVVLLAIGKNGEKKVLKMVAVSWAPELEHELQRQVGSRRPSRTERVGIGQDNTFEQQPGATITGWLDMGDKPADPTLSSVQGVNYLTPTKKGEDELNDCRRKLQGNGVERTVKSFLEMIHKGDWTNAELLVKCGELPANIRDDNGDPALALGSAAGQAAMVRTLVARGANPNVRNMVGATPLMLASAGGYSDVVDVLIKANADVNAADLQGATALQYATKAGKGEIAKRLISAGAK